MATRSRPRPACCGASPSIAPCAVATSTASVTAWHCCRGQRVVRDDWLDEAEVGQPRYFADNGFVVTALQAAYVSITQTIIPADMPVPTCPPRWRRRWPSGTTPTPWPRLPVPCSGPGGAHRRCRWRGGLSCTAGLATAARISCAWLCSRAEGATRCQGWPSATSLAGHYASAYPSDAMAESLPDDPGVVIGNIAGLAGLSPTPDVVVSLCRMGTADVPLGIERHEVRRSTAPIRLRPQPRLDPHRHGSGDCRLAGGRQALNVHCVRAESRTPAVAASYLAHRQHISGVDALNVSAPCSHRPAEPRLRGCARPPLAERGPDCVLSVQLTRDGEV